MTSEKEKECPAWLSIGALSRLSGVQIETIRNWERRYGWPEPIRLESGHRRYPSVLVPHLRLAHCAVCHGLKPSYVTVATQEELSAAVNLAVESEKRDNGRHTAVKHDAEIEEMLFRIEHLDASRFENALRKCWCRYGADTFICDLISPLYGRIENGVEEAEAGALNPTLTMVHEHFATELLCGFLGAQWRPLSSKDYKSRAVITGIEGNHNALPLHMAAIFFAIHNMEVVFLGPDTPVADIVVAAEQSEAVVVAVHCSSCKKGRIADLRTALPPAVSVVVNGLGEGPAISGITRVESMRDLLTNVCALSEIHGGT